MHPLFNTFATSSRVAVSARFVVVGLSLQFASGFNSAAQAQNQPAVQPVAPVLNPASPPHAGASMLMPSLPLPTENRKQQYAVRVRNLKASEMAWRLDPAHNPVPITQEASRRNNALPFVPSYGQAAKFVPAPVLPAGVQQIIAVDPQNILLIEGPEESRAAMIQLVEQQDRPLRQVEIEAQIIRLEPRALEAWKKGDAPIWAPLTMQNTEGDSGLSVYRAGNFQVALAALVNQHQATVLTAPRVTAFDGLTAALGASPYPYEPTGVKDEPDLKAATGFHFTAIPTLNKDETISLTTILAKTLQFSKDNSTAVFPLQALDVLTAKLVLRDGETLILTAPKGRFASLVSGLKFKSNIDAEKQSEVVVALRASIIRRFGDDAPVPGT